ncbi:MAG: hypothetical protein JW938_07535, partial [Candidatus Omnitrophica bacterium]|nr:hypothetical protein [Candidatus Omnitrophota bacterium]
MSSNIILPHFNYIPVDLETFVAHTDIDFDLYIFNPQDQRTVLFCSKDKAFTEGNRRSLLRNKIKELYITANDYMAYLRYVEKVLPSIITSVRFEEKEKVDYIFQCANLIMEDTVDEPDSQANVKRSRRFVKNVINYIGYRTQFFYSFLERLERNYSLRAHSLNVCVYSLAIVKKLNIHSLRTLEDVGLGSLLHDVGMTMIPDEIL